MAWLAGDREADRQRPAQPPLTCGADGVRASDAERDEVLTELGEGFAQGRLSHETFVYRVEAALRARRQDELDDQVADLPAPRPAPSLRSRVDRALRAPLARASAVSRTVQATAGGWLRAPAPPALMLPIGARPRYTIGREWACDMSISHPTVSRWHADLRQAPDGWRLADLGSLNGTRLNGWRIDGSVPVCAGDLVSFGTVTFVLAEAPAGR
jgi:hypothetical protein